MEKLINLLNEFIEKYQFTAEDIATLQDTIAGIDALGAEEFDAYDNDAYNKEPVE